ncbi:hypothetical protein BDQ17DRAFT_691900 [Cyathus striatus]|nr:hypothetical protein BDQ17DRAFT_691900 [Cyathus striatus]
MVQACPNKNKTWRKCGGRGRREEAAQLLSEGKKGDELAHAVLVLRLGFILESLSLSRSEWVTVLVVELRRPLSLSSSLRRINSSGAHRAHAILTHSGLEGQAASAGNLLLFPTPFTYPHQLQAWMHLKMNSDPLPEADTSLFDLGFISGFCLRTVKYSN